MDLPFAKATAQHLKQARLRDRWPIVPLIAVFLVGVILGGLKHRPNMHVLFSSPLVKPLNMQQPAALNQRTIYDADLSSLSKLNQKIVENAMEPACEPTEFGHGWGNHHLCSKLVPTKPCHFYSFGVHTDYSFDVAIADTWGCTGFAADPTIVHNSTLHPGVTFHNIAANSPGVASQPQWLSTTVPSLRKWLRHEHIAVLKMDCEGCEYSLAQDVLNEDPTFFNNVDQFATEIHWSVMWMKGKTEMYALASLFELLEQAGLKLVHVNLTPCGGFATRTGLLPELKEYMGVLFAPGNELHCHNYLFARV